MSSPLLVGVHQPGDSPLHRTPTGVKLLVLAGFSVLVVATRSAAAAPVFLALAVAAAGLGRVHLGTLLRATRAVLVLALLAAGLQWWVDGPAKAVETLIDLVALALSAITLSATTPVNAMLDTLVRALGPLRGLGVDPDRVALAVSLAIGALPGTIALALETRDAARARGLGRHPRAYLTPFVVRVVARAHEQGDALAARGLGD